MVAPHHGGVWALVGGGGAAADPVVLMPNPYVYLKVRNSTKPSYPGRALLPCGLGVTGPRGVDLVLNATCHHVTALAIA